MAISIGNLNQNAGGDAQLNITENIQQVLQQAELTDHQRREIEAGLKRLDDELATPVPQAESIADVSKKLWAMGGEVAIDAIALIVGKWTKK